ncbi:MAG: hypothetical protein IPM23_26065 [Candidatus Melainabacteria bacterium]|nr:hypothetical protein [Candidatus Melainabacteria bacterium]
MKPLKKTAYLSLALMLTCFGQTAIAGKTAAAGKSTHKATSRSKQKTSHRTTRKRASRSGKKYRASGLVPPPPAYAPSILPEIVYSRYRHRNHHKVETADENKEPKASDTYSKHFYTREGDEDPEPVKPNKYVTYWGKG